MTAATAPSGVTLELDPSSSAEDSTPDFEKDGVGDVGVDTDWDDAEEESDQCVCLLTRLFIPLLILMCYMQGVR